VSIYGIVFGKFKRQTSVLFLWTVLFVAYYFGIRKTHCLIENGAAALIVLMFLFIPTDNNGKILGVPAQIKLTRKGRRGVLSQHIY
jgi:hypothetical protein